MNNSTCIPKIFFCDAIDSNASRIIIPDENIIRGCVPQFIKDYDFLFIINTLLIILIGGTGHLLNLIAVPYVYFRYPNKFVRRWNQVTILSLHLSFCDLVYILLGLPFFLSFYIKHDFTFSYSLCWFTGMVRNLNAYTSFYTVAAIALMRMTSDLNSRMTSDLNSSIIQWTLKATILICCSSWIFSFLVLSPSLFNVTWGGVNWGRIVPSPFTGMCDDQNCLLPTQSFSATQILRTIGMDLPFVIILSIYAVVITIKLSRFRHILQDFNLLNVHKTVWMSVLPHLICLIPLQVAVRIWWLTSTLTSIIAFHWYMWIYVANFFIYSASIKDFREMYKIFLKDCCNILTVLPRRIFALEMNNLEGRNNPGLES